MAQIYTTGGLPRLPELQLIAAPGGGGGTGGGGGITWPGSGGPEYGTDIKLPPINITTPAGSGSGTVTEASSLDTLKGAANLFMCFAAPGTCLLRIVLLILGIICVIGAIYLYKPTNEMIIQPTVRAAKSAAVAAAAA